ncbi:MAG TPA: hypothetical protein PKO45_02580 [Rubrivivax sp.]|nr:hypothetical protein [Rubrivivax sp.]
MQTVIPMREEGPARDGRLPPEGRPVAAAQPAQAAPAARGRPAHGPFLPLLLGLAALLTVLLHQLWQLEQERQQLGATLQSAGPQMAAAQQLRQALDRLAADTQRLADEGNAPARTLVDELRRRGITINAAAPAAADPPTPTGR